MQILRIVGPLKEIRHRIQGSVVCPNLRVLELWDCDDCSELLESLMAHVSDLQLYILKIRDYSDCKGKCWLDIKQGIHSCEVSVTSLNGLEELVLGGYGGTEMACVTRHYRTLRGFIWFTLDLAPRPQRQSKSVGANLR